MDKLTVNEEKSKDDLLKASQESESSKIIRKEEDLPEIVKNYEQKLRQGQRMGRPNVPKKDDVTDKTMDETFGVWKLPSWKWQDRFLPSPSYSVETRRDPREGPNAFRMVFFDYLDKSHAFGLFVVIDGDEVEKNAKMFVCYRNADDSIMGKKIIQFKMWDNWNDLFETATLAIQDWFTNPHDPVKVRAIMSNSPAELFKKP